MKKIYTLLLFFGLMFTAQAQDFIMENGVTVNTCSGTFYDPGGPGGNYQNNQNMTYTICPDDPGSTLIIDFVQFGVEDGWDTFTVYDGPTTAAPMIFDYVNFNDPVPTVIESGEANATGCLTFVFTSDFIVTELGWVANIDCELCQEIDLDIVSSVDVLPGDSISPDTIDLCSDLSLMANVSFPENNLEYEQSLETTTFEWTVEGDPNSPYTTQNLDLSFIEQGNYDVNLLVTDVNGCTAEHSYIVINASPNSYLDLTAPTDTICLGEQVPINVSLTHDLWFPETALIEEEPVFLTDIDPGVDEASYSADLGINGIYGPDATISDIECLTVWFEMEHSWVGDLEINVYTPTGAQIILLEDQNGGGVGNGITTNIDFGIPGAGTAPGDGYYYAFQVGMPTLHDYVNGGGGNPIAESDIDAETNIYGFYNTDFTAIEESIINGVWTIEIIDTWGGDDGYVFSWGIDVCDDVEPLPIPINYVEEVWTVTHDGDDVDNSTIISYQEFGVIVEPDETGEYVYTHTVTDNFGCDWTDEVEIYVWGLPDAGDDVTVTCDPNVDLDGELDTEEGGYWTYLGPPGGVATFSPSENVLDPTVTVTELGEYIFILNDNTCQYADSVVVNFIEAIPQINHTDTLICDFTNTLNVANGSIQTGTWTGEAMDGGTFEFADANNPNTTVTVSDYGEYYFTYTFDFCETSTTVRTDFLQQDPVITSLYPDPVYCDLDIDLNVDIEGQEDHWEASGPGIIFFDDFEASSTSASVSEYGTYMFYYYGCGGVDSTSVTFEKLAPELTVPEFVECGFDAYIGVEFVGEPGNLSLIGPGNMLYDNVTTSGGGTTLTVDQVGQYFVTYEQCDTSITHMITFMCEVQVPNVFSPNNDGINDEFIIDRLSPDFYDKSYFTVYNRWGNVVYTNGNYGLNDVWWDGKNSLEGDRLPDGIYYYTLELHNHVRGVDENYSGNITIFTDK